MSPVVAVGSNSTSLSPGSPPAVTAVDTEESYGAVLSSQWLSSTVQFTDVLQVHHHSLTHSGVVFSQNTFHPDRTSVQRQKDRNRPWWRVINTGINPNLVLIV